MCYVILIPDATIPLCAYSTLVQIFYGNVLSILDLVRLIYPTAHHKHHINIMYGAV